MERNELQCRRWKDGLRTVVELYSLSSVDKHDRRPFVRSGSYHSSASLSAVIKTGVRRAVCGVALRTDRVQTARFAGSQSANTQPTLDRRVACKSSVVTVISRGSCTLFYYFSSLSRVTVTPPWPPHTDWHHVPSESSQGVLNVAFMIPWSSTDIATANDCIAFCVIA